MFDELTILNEMITHSRGVDAQFHDENDPEVDRLFNSSPPLIEQVATYELDSVFSVDTGGEVANKEEEGSEEEGPEQQQSPVDSHDEGSTSNSPHLTEEEATLSNRVGRNNNNNKNTLSHTSVRARAINNTADNASGIKQVLAAAEQGHEVMSFVPILVKNMNMKYGSGNNAYSVTTATTSSALTKLLEKSSAVKLEENANALLLTIYLPDFTSLEVNVSESSTFEDVVQKVLRIHQERNLSPPLQYNKPNVYEFCMHEGDGEPDRDFTFQKSLKIKNYYSHNKASVNEYCLCETEESMRESGVRPSMSRARSETVDMLSVQPPNTVLITVPSSRGVGNLLYPITETTTMRDVLLLTAKSHRINLLTDHYCFRITNEDQQKHKLMSPIITLDTIIYSIGVRKFELEKKTYEDSSRVYLGERVAEGKQTKLQTNNNGNRPSEGATGGRKAFGESMADKSGRRGSGLVGSFVGLNNYGGKDDRIANSLTGPEGAIPSQAMVEPEKVEFTNALSAAGYQEWNIIKRNKIGIKQPRVLGIDGQFIYNYKRGERRGNSGVSTATREVSKIVRVTTGDDKKILKITFCGDGLDIYDIEYICEKEADRPEIIGKLKYLTMPGGSKLRNANGSYI
jgi:hypothetical protein